MPKYSRKPKRHRTPPDMPSDVKRKYYEAQHSERDYSQEPDPMTDMFESPGLRGTVLYGPNGSFAWVRS